MAELFKLLVSAPPPAVGLALVGVIVVVMAFVLLPVLKLEAKAWLLRRRGVPRAQIRAWALDEAKREHPSPIVEIIKAIRAGRDDEKRPESSQG